MPLLFRAACACLLAAAAASPAAAQTLLTEQQAVERALADGSFAARGDAERAAARASAAGVPRFDNPDLTLSRSQTSGPAGNETDWEIGVSQPIDLSGRRLALRAARRAEADATDADVRRRRQQRIAEVRRAYLDCTAAVERGTLTAAFAERLRRAERLVTDRAQVGDTAIYDLRRMRVEARAAAAAAAIDQGEERAACSTLALLTGVADARPAARLAAIANPANPTATTAGRADLRALEARLLAASQTLTAARRARIPDVRIGIGYLRREEGGRTSSGPAIGIGVTLPIFNGGGAAVREAAARVRAREAELALARRAADAEVTAAALRATAATEATRLAFDARDDASRLGDIANTSYNSGEISIAELVDAYRAARDAELSIVTLTERAIRAAIDLELAQGGPNP